MIYVPNLQLKSLEIRPDTLEIYLKMIAASGKTYFGNGWKLDKKLMSMVGGDGRGVDGLYPQIKITGFKKVSF